MRKAWLWFIPLLALLLGLGWLARREVATVRGNATLDASDMNALTAAITWPTQDINGYGDRDAPALLAPVGGLRATTTTSWHSGLDGSGQLRYTVKLVPLKTPRGAALAAFADQCDVSLLLNDYQGMLITRIPLTLTPTVGIARTIIALAADDQGPLSETEYASLVGQPPGQMSGGVALQWSCR